MASSKKIGFFWGEEKITIVEFEKSSPRQVISSPLASKLNTPSPFSSNLTEEIQITAILQKLLQDNQIANPSFYVSLPMKEIILRSFVIPFVKIEEVPNVIKFEAKKYIPFDIQDLAFVYYAIPFLEDQTKRLQIIFFAARKEVLAKYERIIKQVNGQIAYCEPYMVSLSKALLFKKEIKPTDHLAFLVLDKNFGRICFIDKGVPQFIREFPIALPSSSDGIDETPENLNLKVINEVGNSFDFYTRQFSGDRIDHMLISSEFVQKDLLNSLEAELKVKLVKFSPVITMGGGPSNDIEAVYAMGACVAPPMEELSEFNFLEEKKHKSRFQTELIAALKAYKEVLFIFLACALVLLGVYLFFQTQLKVIQKQHDQLSLTQGAFSSVLVESIQAESQQNIDKLNALKSIRTKSDVVLVMLRLASHLPQGSLLGQLDITYDGDDVNNTRVSINMRGYVFKGDSNEEIAVVNQIFSDIKNDKELAKYIKSVNLVSLNRNNIDDKQATEFNIHCS